MRIIYGLESPVFRNPVVTIGNFDGLHIGHQKILDQLCIEAGTCDGESVVITFREHPKRVLYPENDLHILTTLDEKIFLMEKTKIDNLVIMDFTKELSVINYGDFIKNFLIEKAGMKHLVIGYDHAFGKNRIGDIDHIKNYSKKMGFSLTWIDPCTIDGDPVSSTRIKQEIVNGNLECAAVLLGRNYSLTGFVVHGNHIGATIGFPTANVDYSDFHKVVPQDGVYAGVVEIGGSENCVYGAVINIGYNPTIGNSNKTIEAHILDYSGNIYGHKITLTFLHYIRSEMKFVSRDLLQEQIASDITFAGNYLKEKYFER